ncbi:hypothetical protein [Halobacillus salinus]|uniref:hypothetical protein n=1 Tax=Halobacillus salinus TaxID=192814 RepID=UPI0009A5D118|nr:hypothetical protein [Halobacillus salinus]
MSKAMIKGTISVIVGAIVFYCLFFLNSTDDLFEMAIWGAVSCVLGYVFLSSFIMSNKETEEFEKKVDDTFSK